MKRASKARAWLASGLLAISVLGCDDSGSDSGADPNADANELFAPLPDGYRYGPPPRGERERVAGAFDDSEVEDVELRRVFGRGSGAAVVLGAIMTPDVEIEAVQAGFESTGGRLVPQAIGGEPFLVGTDTFGNHVAMRSDGDRYVVIYAASPSDLRYFARPFARDL